MRLTRARASRISFAAVLSACLLGGAGTGGALAQTGTTVSQGAGGGATYVSQPDSTLVVAPRSVTRYAPRPRIKAVSCVRSCARLRRARIGSTLRLRGSSFGAVTKVVFHGRAGRADDVSAPARPASSRRFHVKVPAGARSGRLSAFVSRNLSSRQSRWLRIMGGPTTRLEDGSVLSAAPIALPGASLVETATSRRSVFVGEERSVSFWYRITAPAPISVQVLLRRAADGAVVASWPVRAAAPRTLYRVSLEGTGASPLAPGRYGFELGAAGAATAARSSSTPTPGRDAFEVVEHHVFPIQGKHDYGSTGARFGAGRSSHSHQGHDVFAACGTPLVAARGGKVQYNGYHSAAGYYVVIDGDGTSVDYAYMHMTGRSSFAKGARVLTGQRIGSVGQTGNARGCHLHFEMWGAPGWYEGGHAYDPLPYLKAWDAAS